MKKVDTMRVMMVAMYFSSLPMILDFDLMINKSLADTNGALILDGA